MVEEEIGDLTEKQQEFLRIIELVKPSRFFDEILAGCGLGYLFKELREDASCVFSQVGL